MKIALGQINPVVGDFEHNAGRIVDAARQAARQGCQLAVFPELSVCGYPPRDLLVRNDFIAAAGRCLADLVAAVDDIAVICGTVTANAQPGGNPLFNTAVLFEHHRIQAEVHKRLLPTYDVFDERRYFEPGTDCRCIDFKGLRLAVAICEDGWNVPEGLPERVYAIDPVERMAADGAELMVNISASPFHTGKREQRWRMLSATARRHGLPLAYVNQVGGNDGVLFEGGSVAFDRSGRMVARAAEFAPDMVVFESSADMPDPEQMRPAAGSDPESVFAALVMGTRDYLHKCGFHRAAVGLSGGVDSALTLCVAAEALGSENVTAIFMPSRYTSADNDEDTRRLAANLGVPYEVVPIHGMLDALVSGLPLPLDTQNPGITEQNLQARIRGTILMAYANQHGSLVLSTGNKSEMAVGYCTLYGDMNGGLAVISDVPKMLVYAVCRHINRGDEIIPARILEKPPSAELKPDQTDQDDLPPYEVLDAVLEAYIEKVQDIETIVSQGFARETVLDIIGRLHRNEYKRKQAPPGLKVTPKAFGEGRRFPIVQGFRR